MTIDVMNSIRLSRNRHKLQSYKIFKLCSSSEVEGMSVLVILVVMC